jgi:transcriptional regulator with XRE-family HTH domain
VADIGEKLRLARVEAGLTVRQAAEASGRSKDSISKIERGLQAPTPLTVGKLARAYGVSPVEFLADIPRKKAPAPPPGQRSFENHLTEERRAAFIERVKNLIERRVAHYEKRLSEAEQGRGPFAGYEGARVLFDDAFDEFIELPDFINGELAERWMLDPEVPEDVKVDLGRAVGEIMAPFTGIIERIGEREAKLAETEAQRIQVEQRRQQVREQTRKISAA